MQEQAELIGLPTRAGGLVGTRVELHVLDQIFHAPALAIDLVVEMLGAAGEIGDDEACIGAERRRLDAGDHLVRPAPGARLVLELMEAAHGGFA